MEWIYFDDKLPEEKETMFSKIFGTDKYKKDGWKTGMFKTARYNLLFTIEDMGQRIVVDGRMIDGKPICDYAMSHTGTKYIAWMPYPEPIRD